MLGRNLVSIRGPVTNYRSAEPNEDFEGASTRMIKRKPPPRIGVAGWGVPAACRTAFGDGDSVLARYATRLNCVEINSSFYRPHQRKTYERWAETVPASFRFSIKMPKTITHEHALQGCAGLLDRFIDQCSGLEQKLGVLLIQLPPSLVFDARVVSTFFAMTERRLPKFTHLACEPRHASWLAPAAEALMNRHGVSRVGADPDPIGANGLPSKFGTCRYWRLHGAPRVYYSAYNDDALDGLARKVNVTRSPAWVIFDNTAAGHAVGNALTFARKFDY